MTVQVKSCVRRGGATQWAEISRPRQSPLTEASIYALISSSLICYAKWLLRLRLSPMDFIMLRIPQRRVASVRCPPHVNDSHCSQWRSEISDEVKEGMKGAAKATILALTLAAQTTQNVPYLGAISTALTEFMKIQGVRQTPNALHVKAYLDQ